MKHCKTLLAASVTLVLAAIQTAQAHTSFVIDATSVPFANSNYTGTLRAGHGCEDEATGEHYDTEKIYVEIPAGVTGVKPFDAAWADASIETNSTTGITTITWTRRANLAVQPADTHLYTVSFRGKLPDAPLTSLAFRVVQVCNGGTLETAWEGANAAMLNLVPARSPGWNKYTIGVAVPDAAALKKFFGDALIVWSNNAAYSANPVTDGLITNKLTTIPASQEFWVKY
jgi:uncharacterized protein YcnI